MSLQNLKNQKGFTIVELLIVIVVIGILAAIVIVAYNGVTQRANTSAARGNAEAVVKAAETYNAENGVYPTLAQVEGSGNIASLPSGLDIVTTGTLTQTSDPTDLKYVFTSTSVGACVSYFDYTAGSEASMSIGTAC